MELALVVWLISIAESLSRFLGFICFASIVVCLSVLFFKSVTFDDAKPILAKTKLHIWLTLLAFVSGFTAVVLPTEKQGYIIAGAYITQKIAESGGVQEIGGKMLLLINQKLDEAIKSGEQVTPKEPAQ